MYRQPIDTAHGHCSNINCSQWNVPVEVPWTRATFDEPAGWAFDTCPTCGDSLIDEHVDVDHLATEILDECYGYHQPTVLDEKALMQVILAELHRQSNAEYHEQKGEEVTEGMPF